MGKLAVTGGRPVRNKPFRAWPEYGAKELKALAETLESGEWGGYPSPNRRADRFAREFASFSGAEHGICAVNGTVTLEIALRAAGVKAGDEVIVTPYSWIATAATPVYINAVPVFADVSPHTYCLDAKRVEEAITPRTRAIIPVHLGCRMADMDALMKIAKKHDLVVIEDCAHMHGGRWKDKGAGAIGHLGSFSFQSSKLLTAGEGGIILTSDNDLAERCHSLVNCGRKEDGYNNFDGDLFGWNYRIGEFQAAILSSQLERLPKQTLRREANVATLESLLSDIKGLKPLKRDRRYRTMGCYQYILRYDSRHFKGVHRDQFVQALEAEGIPCDGYFYIPIYQSNLFPLRAVEYPQCRKRYGKSIDPKKISCPVTENAAMNEAIWFHHPLFLGTKKDMEDIARAIKKISKNIDELL